MKGALLLLWIISKAQSGLSPDDHLTIETDDRIYEVDLSRTSEPSNEVNISDVRQTHSEGEIILTIRKPDLLGQAMWQFSHGRVNISAPIRDESWLADFHGRRIALYSGDALKCKVNFTYIYDDDGDLIEQKIEIIKVLEIIRGSGPQIPLFERER